MESPKETILTKQCQQYFNRYDGCGWTPCLSGTLDFSRIKCGMGEKGTKVDTIIDDQAFFVSSVKDWNDKNIPKKDGKFEVIFTGTVDKNDSTLTGDIFIFPMEYTYYNRLPLLKKVLLSAANVVGPSNIQFESANDKFVQLPKKFKQISDHKKSPQERKELIREVTNELANNKDASELYHVKFAMTRSGFTFLKLQPRKEGPQEHQKTTKETVLRQAFYYAKYALHTHKHHPHDDDSTSTFVLREKSDSYISFGEKLLDSFSSALVTAKRVADNHESTEYDLKGESYQLQGTVSYGHSLAKALIEVGFITETVCNLSISRMNNLQSSLEARANLSDLKAQNREKKKSESRTLAAFLLAIFSTLMISSSKVFDTPKEQLPKGLWYEYGRNIHNIVTQNISFSLFIALLLLILIYGAGHYIQDKFSTWRKGIFSVVFENIIKGAIMKSRVSVLGVSARKDFLAVLALVILSGASSYIAMYLWLMIFLG